MLQGIYAITDHYQTSDAVIERKITAALEGGVRTIVLRDPNKNDNEILALAKRLSPLLQSYEARLLSYERPELAAEHALFDGVHVDDPQADPVSLRTLLGDKLLGFTCGDDLKRAAVCERAKADFVVLGSFWYSFSQPERPVVEHAILSEAKKELTIPVVALGGVTVDNAPILAKRHPDMIGMVSGLWLTPNPATTARKVLAHL